MGQARALKQVRINGTNYFVDERLGELRNVEDPHDSIPIGSVQLIDVEFSVRYKTTIVVLEGSTFEDEVTNIDIPESETCEYITDSFDPTPPVVDRNEGDAELPAGTDAELKALADSHMPKRNTGDEVGDWKGDESRLEADHERPI